MIITYSLKDVEPYINWIYFYHAWGMSGKPEKEKQQLRHEAEALIDEYGQRYSTYALFNIFQANSEADDIVLDLQTACYEVPQTLVAERQFRLPMLRQQTAGSDFLSLADFVRPASQGIADRIAVFATSADIGMEQDFQSDPYRRMMMQLIADRAAEATIERAHQEIRRLYWGFAPDENFTVDELFAERWQGIRPAVGYPSLPDASINFLIDRLLDMKQIGVTITESGAMRPHASVSGLIFSLPAARYFDVGRIGEDQFADYARRRGLPADRLRKFLIRNLE